MKARTCWLASAVVCCVHLFSQIPDRRQRLTNVWTDAGLLTLNPPHHASGVGSLAQEKGERKIPNPPPAPKDSEGARSAVLLRFHAPQGHLFACYSWQVPAAKEPGSTRKTVAQVFSFDPERWAWNMEPLGTLESPTSALVILSEDWILGIAAQPDMLVERGKGRLFALYRRNAKGQYQLDSFPDDGFDGTAITGTTAWKYPMLSMVWINKRQVYTADRTCLYVGQGLVWVFTDKGRMTRLVRLFDGLDDKGLKQNLLWQEAVLGVQPRPDGTLLVSTLNENALALGALVQNEGLSRGTAAGDRDQAIRERVITSKSPILWYDLDPVTGDLRDEAPPRNVKAGFGSIQEFLDFNWSFKRDGNLHFTSEADLSKISAEAEAMYKERYKTPGPKK
jgi:hypothetical protein